MIKKILITNLILGFLFTEQSCEQKNTEKPTPLNNKKELNVVKIDSGIQTVQAFLKWYNNNQDKLYQFQSIKGGVFSENQEADNYYVDFGEVDKEIKFLFDSQLFTQNFLDQYRQNYVQGEEHFKQVQQNDGPPFGFDYDYFFMTQDDYTSDLKNISKIKFNSVSKNDSTNYISFHLDTCGMTYRYILKKKYGHWKIDAIENKF